MNLKLILFFAIVAVANSKKFLLIKLEAAGKRPIIKPVERSNPSVTSSSGEATPVMSGTTESSKGIVSNRMGSNNDMDKKKKAFRHYYPYGYPYGGYPYGHSCYYDAYGRYVCPGYGRRRK